MNESFKTAMEQIAAHPILIQVQIWHDDPSNIFPRVEQYLQMFIQMGFVDIDILKDGAPIRDTAVLKSLHDLPNWTAAEMDRMVFQMKTCSIWPLLAFAELIKNLPDPFGYNSLRHPTLFTHFHSAGPYELVHDDGGHYFMWMEVAKD